MTPRPAAPTPAGAPAHPPAFHVTPSPSPFRDLVERIRDANDILAVVSERLPLDRSHRALCPFHAETSPSFHVVPAGQYFHCFGCGAGGDVFRFVELRDRVPFMEALRLLAARAEIPLAGVSHHDILHMKETRLVGEVLAAAAAYYHARLTPAARDYLRARGLSDETIARFRIGWASGGLLEHLTRDGGFRIETCLRAGVVRKTNGGRAGDFFSDRIVIPNIVRGRVVHLTSRSLGDAEPRHLHLPGPIPHLYNEDALRAPEALLAEGVFDCLAAEQAGFPCAALYGAGPLKADRLARLASSPAVLYLCLDGDAPGREAALRLADSLGERARLVDLPDGLDLADFLLARPPADLRALLDASPTLVAREILSIPASSPKTELPRLLAPVLARLARLGRPEAEAYLQYLVRRRFELRKEDVDAYRATVKRHRDEAEASDPGEQGAESSGTFVWEDYQPFNPAQDYRAGKAYFTVHLQRRLSAAGPLVRRPYVVTSDREIFPLARAELDARGLRLQRADQVPSDTARWSASRAARNGVHAFLRGEASVDPAALFDRIRALFARYLDYPEPLYYDFLPLWCVGTYLFMAFESYPYVYLSGTKRTGKTRTIEVASPICFNSVMSASMSDAAMYRSTENDRCTVFHDEAARYSRKNRNDPSERLEIFNSGYKRSGSVRRCVGDDSVPTDFSTYSPKLLASIEGLERTSADRAITLHLLRARDEVPKFSHRLGEAGFREIRDSLYVLALAHHAEIARIYAGLDPVKGLRDREDELWSPVFALAEFFDAARLARDPGIAEADLLSSRMIRLAFSCRDRKQEDELEENPDNRILAALLDFLDGRAPLLDQDGAPTDLHASDAVLAHVVSRDGLEWVTKHHLGKVLLKLQILKDRRTDRPWLRTDGRRLTPAGKQVLCYRLPADRVNDVAVRYALRGPDSILEAGKC